MQRLLNHAVWDQDQAQGVVRRFVVEQLGDQPLRVGALDESGQEKHGDATAGVERQYMGCAGRVTNGVNTVYCSYATPGGCRAGRSLAREPACGGTWSLPHSTSESAEVCLPSLAWSLAIRSTRRQPDNQCRHPRGSGTLADARAGCDVAVITVQPGSKSQHNAHRQGFDLLYTRAVLVRQPVA